MLDMAECRRSESKDGRADLCIRDYLNTEDVCEPWAAIIPKGAEDEILALLIEDKNA